MVNTQTCFVQSLFSSYLVIGMSRKFPDSFASCHFTCGSEENTRSSGKLQLKPYFGHFSGSWMTFDVRKNLDFAGNHKIRVKIEGYLNSTSIHLRALKPVLDFSKSATRLKLKEICLQYVHSLKPPKFELKHSPQKLVFLCERKVLLNLNDIDTSVLPPTFFSHLNPVKFLTQDVHIKVWFGSSSFPTIMERMKVKQGILISELQWMLCNKLPVKVEPSKLDMYEYWNIEKVSENSYLSPNQVNFHCVVLPDNHQDSIVVSVVGHGIEQIKLGKNMTLNEFQHKIKEKFGLHPSSFIFIPSLFNSSNFRQIAMSAVLDKSTVWLLDNCKRNLPMVDNIPLISSPCEKLEAFNCTLTELNLLSSNLVYVYEVTGPTIPIFYRSSTSVGKGEYALISDRLHAVSINLSWSVRTLLKYIEDISHFPCEDISYKGSILPLSSLLGEYFTNCCWKVKGNNITDMTEGVPKVITA